MKKGSAKPNGNLPLMCRLMVDGEIKQFSAARWIKITTFFIGIIIILSIIGMLMQFLMIIIFQNSIEQDDTKAIDMDSPIFEEELIPITEEDMKSIPEDTIKFR